MYDLLMSLGTALSIVMWGELLRLLKHSAHHHLLM
jgi:hypothetical protein